MRLQVDNEFQQVKIKDMNDENNVEIFTSPVRGAKAFAQKFKVTPTKIIQNLIQNMNIMKSVKYGLLLEEIEK